MTSIYCGTVCVEGDARVDDLRKRALHHGSAFDHSSVLSGARAVLAGSGDGIWYHGTHVTLVFFGYVTNLDDVIRLCPQAAVTPNGSDAARVAALYEAGGIAALRTLEGSYSYALWDGDHNKMILARDPFGGRPLYYRVQGSRVDFATSVRLLKDVFDVPYRANLLRLAQFALDPNAKLDMVPTFYEGVQSVAPATLMVLDENGMTQDRYWIPGEVTADVPTGDAFWEALRAHIYRAVEAQLPREGPAFALLSGGLDSSSITAVAADILAQRGQTLTTLSAVTSETLDGQPSEEDFIRLFGDNPNIVQKFVTAPERGPLDNLDELVAHTETPLVHSRHFLYSAFSKHVSEAGGGSLMDGVWGEQGPTAHATAFFPEMLLQGRWGVAWREARLLSKRYNLSFTSVLRSRVVRPFVKRSSPQRAGGFLASILNPEFLSLYEGQFTSSFGKGAFGPFNQRQAQKGTLKSSQKSSMTALAQCLGETEFRFPFRDRKLMEFCLNAPTNLKIHDGYDRYLIRHALDGLLPKKIQNRTSKAPLSVDYNLRYNRQRQQALDRFHAIGAKNPIRDVVDVDRLIRLASLDMTDSTGARPENIAGLQTVPLGANVVAFLQQFPEFS